MLYKALRLPFRDGRMHGAWRHWKHARVSCPTPGTRCNDVVSRCDALSGCVCPYIARSHQVEPAPALYGAMAIGVFIE